MIGAPSTMATSRYKDKDGGVLFSFSGVWISWLHTILAYCTEPAQLLPLPPFALELSLIMLENNWLAG